MKFLFSDSWHFHKKNYEPVFRALKEEKIDYIVESTQKKWWKAHGDYGKLISKDSLGSLNFEKDRISTMAVDGICLWPLVRSEFLCHRLSDPRWHNLEIANSDEEIIGFLRSLPDELRTLEYCFLAAHQWINFWQDYLGRNEDITHAIVFSGSYIYTRSLMAVAQKKQISCFVTEHFFTGDHFYFEKRYTPIANHSQLHDLEIASTISLKSGSGIAPSLVNYVVSQMRNKNVRPFVTYSKESHFSERDLGTVLIIGQVLNDFSLIETTANHLSSLALYKKLIFSLSNANLNVVFKAHPWERKRPNLMSPITLTSLQDYVSTLSEYQQKRISFKEFEPIQSLFLSATHIVGISSQGLLEACHFGLKPALFGSSFFDSHGFIDSYADINSFVNHIFHGRKGRLTFEEYNSYLRYMESAFFSHLVPNNHWGVSAVKAKIFQIEHNLLDDPGYRRFFLLKTNDSISTRMYFYFMEFIERPIICLRDAMVYVIQHLK
jgi:hypothetical protein